MHRRDVVDAILDASDTRGRTSISGRCFVTNVLDNTPT
jgi:hypothetical protein